MFNFSSNQYNTPYITNNESNGVVDFDALQKARHDLIEEIQAIIDYDEHIHTTTNKLAKETWEDIKNEELNHVGNLLGLMNYLDSTQRQYVESGFAEFTKRMK